MLNDSHIQAVASGDHNAFRQMFDEWEHRMLFYAYRLTSDRTSSQDIIQDAFVLFWDKRELFDNILSAKAFIYTTIKHKIWHQARNNVKRQHILRNIKLEPHDDEDDMMIVAEICGQVQQMIKELPPQSRKVIELSMQGFTVEKIAEKMDISPNTVKSLKKSAYKALRNKLGHLKILLYFLISV